jgi:hypothetical protein
VSHLDFGDQGVVRVLLRMIRMACLAGGGQLFLSGPGFRGIPGQRSLIAKDCYEDDGPAETQSR